MIKIAIGLYALLALNTKILEAKEQYFWASASQGQINSIVDSFSPFQLIVDRKMSGIVTFKSKQINLALRSAVENANYPVSVLFNPTVLCNVNGRPVSSTEVNIEVNSILYRQNTIILIDDDQFRQYRIIIKLLGLSSARRGSVLCDIRNALVISS